MAIKWLHILSATFMFGTGFGTAFYMFFANRSGNVPAIAVVTRLVARADWWFTTPAIIIQPLSGLWMMHLAGFPLGSRWIVWSIALYLLAGACWLPVVWLQLRMRDMAALAAAQGAALPSRYWQYEKIWTGLGFPAFGALLVVYWLMVHKPA
ncbi:putative membrane protein [Duganella sp. SG902]|nr:putative membrane protein [Duganella sp. SG902]